jgi:hypothetical protein
MVVRNEVIHAEKYTSHLIEREPLNLGCVVVYDDVTALREKYIISSAPK